MQYLLYILKGEKLFYYIWRKTNKYNCISHNIFSDLLCYWLQQCNSNCVPIFKRNNRSILLYHFLTFMVWKCIKLFVQECWIPTYTITFTFLKDNYIYCCTNNKNENKSTSKCIFDNWWFWWCVTRFQVYSSEDRAVNSPKKKLCFPKSNLDLQKLLRIYDRKGWKIWFWPLFKIVN